MKIKFVNALEKSETTCC